MTLAMRGGWRPRSVQVKHRGVLEAVLTAGGLAMGHFASLGVHADLHRGRVGDNRRWPGAFSLDTIRGATFTVDGARWVK